jgi:hypothetical protein
LRETFEGSRDDGLIQRLQVSVYPDATAGWRNVDRRPDADAQRQAFEIFEHLTNLDGGFVSFGSDRARTCGGYLMLPPAVTHGKLPNINAALSTGHQDGVFHSSAACKKSENRA